MFRRLAFTLSILVAAVGMTFAQTITVAIDVDPPQLDPAYSTAFVDRQVQYNIFDRLLDVNDSMEIVPYLVTSWEVSEDGLVYTMHLQDGVTFHDGTPLDAAAVKYNLDRSRAPGTRRETDLNQVVSVDVLDELTFQVVLSEASPAVLGAFTDRAGMMLSPTALEEMGVEEFQRHPVGSGAFVFDSRVRGDQVVLTRNPDYWRDGQPLLDKVIFRVVPDENVAVANLLSGQLDVLQTRSIADQQVAMLQQNPNVTVEVGPGIGWQGIWLNTLEAPFDDANIRRALSLSVDRAVIAQVVYSGAAVPSWGPYSPITPFNDGVEPVRDLEAAKAAVAESSYGEGVSFTFTIGTGNAYQRLAEVLQSMWAEAGINAKINVIEYGQLLNDLDEFNFQAALAGWSGRADPDQDITPFNYTGGDQNYASYSNPEFDRIIDESRVATGDERVRLLQEAVQILREDVPYVFLVHQSQKIAYANSVHGLSAHPDGMIRLAGVSVE